MQRGREHAQLLTQRKGFGNAHAVAGHGTVLLKQLRPSDQPDTTGWLIALHGVDQHRGILILQALEQRRAGAVRLPVSNLPAGKFQARRDEYIEQLPTQGIVTERRTDAEQDQVRYASFRND